MRLEMPYTLLVALNPTGSRVFHAGTAWISTQGLKSAWPEFLQMASQAEFRAVAALQVTNDIYTAGAVTEIGTPLASDGANFGVQLDLAAAIANFRWVRFGWNVWYNAGGTPLLFARCGGFVDVVRDDP